MLREHVATESVDLIYLDPPFNSKRDYNLLFKSPKGVASEAQIEAFEDTWHWNEQAEREFDELLHQPNTQVADMMRALRSFLGENDMMAYLTMMANRLLELHRVLKPTGSLYLHCDPTASHYLKIVLDGCSGKRCSEQKSAGSAKVPTMMRSKVVSNTATFATLSFSTRNQPSGSGTGSTRRTTKSTRQISIASSRRKPADVIVSVTSLRPAELPRRSVIRITNFSG